MEFAIVSPLVFLVLLGTIEFGIQFNDFQSVRAGVRDAARVASVDRVPSSCSPTTSATDDLICYVKERVGLGAATAAATFVIATIYAPCASFMFTGSAGSPPNQVNVEGMVVADKVRDRRVVRLQHQRSRNGSEHQSRRQHGARVLTEWAD